MSIQVLKQIIFKIHSKGGPSSPVISVAMKCIEVRWSFRLLFLWIPCTWEWCLANLKTMTEIKRKKNHILVAVWKQNMVSHTLLQLGWCGVQTNGSFVIFSVMSLFQLLTLSIPFGCLQLMSVTWFPQIISVNCFLMSNSIFWQACWFPILLYIYIDTACTCFSLVEYWFLFCLYYCLWITKLMFASL